MAVGCCACMCEAFERECTLHVLVLGFLHALVVLCCNASIAAEVSSLHFCILARAGLEHKQLQYCAKVKRLNTV